MVDPGAIALGIERAPAVAEDNDRRAGGLWRGWHEQPPALRAAFHFAREDLLRYAGEVGLDATRFQACVDERRFKDKVEADLQAARAVGISGTPAFVVDGVLLSGAQPASEFYEVIDAALAQKGGAPASAAGAGGSS